MTQGEDYCNENISGRYYHELQEVCDDEARRKDRSIGVKSEGIPCEWTHGTSSEEVAMSIYIDQIRAGEDYRDESGGYSPCGWVDGILGSCCGIQIQGEIERLHPLRGHNGSSC